jgi:tetratricopeptide (TPR) repeat protein
VTSRGLARAASAIIVAAVLLAFANAWPGAWQFDDFVAIVDEPRVHDWASWWASMPGMRPLLKASYVLSWRMGAHGPLAFLAQNVVLHVVNALLVAALARRLMASLAPDVAANEAGVALAATLAALVFALHPAATEAVTYLSGRSTSLATALWLVALVMWLRDTVRSRAAALAAFAAAVAAKETAIAWPLAVLLVEGLRDGRWRAAVRRSAAPLALAALAAGAILAVPAYRRMAAASLALRDPLANLAVAVDGIAYLVGHPLLTLRTDIDPAIAPGAFGPRWWIAAVAIVAVLACGAAALRPRGTGDTGGTGVTVAVRRPLMGFAIGWLAIALLPVQSLVARDDVANDRQLYLALAGPAIVLGIVVARWRSRRGVVVAAAALVVVLAAATLVRNRDYADEVTLWRATTAASPGKSRPWNNLGVALAQRGDTAGARRAYERALALDPSDVKARVNLELLGREGGSGAAAPQ